MIFAVIIIALIVGNSIAVDIITTIAGNGTVAYNGDNIAATSATLKGPRGVALDSSGNVYFTDYSNQRIRKITVSTGMISTVMGNGTAGYSGNNGPATSAMVYNPWGISIDSSDDIYVTDMFNNRIRKTTVSTGIVTNLAGSSSVTSYSGDNGQATSATFSRPRSVAVDTSGNVYIADTGNNRIRKITISTGVLTTVAGSSTSGSFTGDDGAATSATLNGPYSIVLDSSGNMYIADRSNNRIRKVTTTGIISTIAGTGSASYSGDNGAPTSATLNGPRGLALDSSGNLYISDQTNHRVRKITSSTGLITTIAGSSTSGGFGGDRDAATSARLYTPSNTAVDSSGNVYIADVDNQRIRKVTMNAPTRAPTAIPTITPTVSPTETPTIAPSAPTNIPSSCPSSIPSGQPSSLPSMQPSSQPSRQPSGQPSGRPSGQPSRQPTNQPTGQPTRQPSSMPTSFPTIHPTSNPSCIPSSRPSNNPTAQPSGAPSRQPTRQPTGTIPITLLTCLESLIHTSLIY